MSQSGEVEKTDGWSLFLNGNFDQNIELGTSKI
jgi:hypothetical protein